MIGEFGRLIAQVFFHVDQHFFALIVCGVSPGISVPRGLWKMKVPVKVKVFGWLLLLGKLNSQYVLQKKKKFHLRNYSQIGVCSAKRTEENINHLFVHCSFSLKVWAELLSELGVVWMIPRSSLDLVGLSHGLRLVKGEN